MGAELFIGVSGGGSHSRSRSPVHLRDASGTLLGEGASYLAGEHAIIGAKLSNATAVVGKTQYL